MSIVNSGINIIPIEKFVDKSNAKQLLDGHHVVVDALDCITSRLILQEACSKLGLPFVHGAIAGWYGQVCTILPGDNTLNKIYKENISHGAEKELGNPAFIPALVSSIQVSETVKILINRGDLLRNKLFFINTLSNEYDIIDLQG